MAFPSHLQVNPDATRTSKSTHKYDLRSSTTSAATRPLPVPVTPQPKSSAARHSINASSTVCGAVNLFNMLNIVRPETLLPETFIANSDVDKYSLCDLVETCQDLSGEERCGNFIKEKLPKAKSGHLTVLCNREIACENFKEQSMSLYSSTHKPDVGVYQQKKWLILPAEVISCTRRNAFENTIRKLILGLIDIIRYYTFFNQELSSFKGLVFPKPIKKNFAVEVEVKFQNFRFLYTMKAIAKAEVKNKVVEVFQHNQQLVETIKKSVKKFKPYFYITLSNNAMGAFGSDYKQIEAKEAMMFLADGMYYKVPISKQDAANLEYICLKLELRKMNCVIDLTEEKRIPQGFKYQAVHYSPLLRSEAQKCLLDLVRGIYSALTELHDAELCHLDVRLENICFTEEFHLKLIDLDRSRRTNGNMDFYDSCMYDPTMSMEGNDWRQLACLILWVVSNGAGKDYHKLDLRNITHEIKNDKFVCDLWEGKLSL